MPRRALITGFAAYGSRSINPAARLAQALDRQEIGGMVVAGRILPVTLGDLADRLEKLLDETRPALVIALGLSPGEPMIRLERFGVNLADFEIPDAAGHSIKDAPLVEGGVTALAATLPLRAIEEALLAEGIPARLSNSAGTYLCNAALYRLLAAVGRRGVAMPCGFIHLPYLPEQVADMLSQARAGRIEIHQRADLASMDYAAMERALRIAIAASAQALVPDAAPAG